MAAPTGSESHADLVGDIAAILDEMTKVSRRFAPLLNEVAPHFRDSAENLLHYMVLRHRDRRSLQMRLAPLGFSTLGRAESHVRPTVEAVLGALRGDANVDARRFDCAFETSERTLRERTDRLFGPPSASRSVRIMVTMPGEAADDETLIPKLLEHGMECMRVNCAHDDVAVWQRMIERLRRAEAALDKRCRVLMDLGGPKLRTGTIEPGPELVRVKPSRDQFGHVVQPARIWVTSDAYPVPAPVPAVVSFRVSPRLLARLEVGDRVQVRDTRDAKRTLKVTAREEYGAWLTSDRTLYVVNGTTMRHESRAHGTFASPISGIPAREGIISVARGDKLKVLRSEAVGHQARRAVDDTIIELPSIGCTLPAALANVRAGERIWFDDGKIGGTVDAVAADHLLVVIDSVPVKGAVLRADKGINLPDTEMNVPALTARDIADLDFVARNADIVGLSFVHEPEDVDALHAQLAARVEPGRMPAIMLKIETRRGFDRLPELLLRAMRMPNVGVMIARGDLAVECGFERLAEVQEEILWICEAAHVPAIWATQVLEQLAKEGMRSRAEVTDAAMGDRAECVMLNKGKYVLDAMRALDDILRRMESHQIKKRSMLRQLRVATNFIENGIAATTRE
ncbi:MAG: pyruvate kinase [Phycisphaerales bacterium]